MELELFKGYLEKFESLIILPGLKEGLFGKELMVSIRKGRLDSTEFGKIIGNTFEYNKFAAIDYYGLIKKSTALQQLNGDGTAKVKSVKALVIHFASVKIEYISDIRPELVMDFPAFKKELIRLRGFK